MLCAVTLNIGLDVSFVCDNQKIALVYCHPNVLGHLHFLLPWFFGVVIAAPFLFVVFRFHWGCPYFWGNLNFWSCLLWRILIIFHSSLSFVLIFGASLFSRLSSIFWSSWFLGSFVVLIHTIQRWQHYNSRQWYRNIKILAQAVCIPDGWHSVGWLATRLVATISYIIFFLPYLGEDTFSEPVGHFVAP